MTRLFEKAEIFARFSQNSPYSRIFQIFHLLSSEQQNTQKYMYTHMHTPLHTTSPLQDKKYGKYGNMGFFGKSGENLSLFKKYGASRSVDQ